MPLIDHGTCSRIGAVATGSGAEGLGAGAAAGFGVAAPLGAVGVLLLQLGIRHGLRPAAAAATGVALVDLAYCALALGFGAALTPLLAGRERAVRLVAAAVLVAVAVHALAGLRRPVRAGVPEPQGSAAPARVLLRFVGLTAVNPLTALYFVVLAAALGGSVSPSTAVAFAAGVFVASWGWQLGLAAVGAAAGARLPPSARTVTTVAGNLVVLGYAAHLALG